MLWLAFWFSVGLCTGITITPMLIMLSTTLGM
jgi:ferredoxin-NADP reductase